MREWSGRWRGGRGPDQLVTRRRRKRRRLESKIWWTRSTGDLAVAEILRLPNIDFN